MRTIRVVLLMALLISACGSTSHQQAAASPGTSASPRATPTSTQSVTPPPGSTQTPPYPSGGYLVIASGSGSGSSHTETIQIINPQGKVVATAQFMPPALPSLSNCGDVLQPPVRVAGGAAFFADSGGVIRRLSPDGSITKVATFQLTNKQQYLSFAVSPDGQQLIAIVLSTPPLHNPPPQTLGDPMWAPGGTWKLDLERAIAGGSTTLVLRKDLGSAFPSPTIITGWDDSGPTATLNTKICTQQGLPSYLYSGVLIHLALDGTHLDRIGGGDCNAWDELHDGTVLCGGSSGDSFSVRNRTGGVLWSRQIGCCIEGASLSPDGTAVATGIVGPSGIWFNNPAGPVSAGRLPELGPVLGWAGAQYVVVLRPDGRFGLAAAVDPSTFIDLGVKIDASCLICLPPYGPFLAGTIGIT